MRRCADCGHLNRAEARFCDSCGAPLQREKQPIERRKLATLLFCDVSGSTAMGERVDAESVRELMFSYFHEMRGAIERHGGTVEKFVGDAVMAVFGVPLAHEDDALRAVRAAFEMQERLASLNSELQQRFGSTIALRIGVNTGEVVAGDASLRQALVTGDAVNVAARLEQAASPGEILLGEETFRLCRDAVGAEPVPALSLKGKAEPLRAYRLLAVEPSAPARRRRLDTPLVGRERELALLEERLSQARSGRATLVTIVGEPGVGKSRLAGELLARARADFQIFSGRCLPYGEGITYWALAEIVRQAAGIRDEHSREEALARIERLVPGDVAAVVGQAVGLTDGSASTEDIAVATGDLVVSLAQRRPILLLVDDIHWADQTLLDLLRRLPGTVGDERLFLLCLARPELLEEHAGWQSPLRLEPLDEANSSALVEELLGSISLPEGVAQRVTRGAGGNPLFVEELVGMLIDDGLLVRRNDEWVAAGAIGDVRVPATLRELLGARLDRLPQGERSTLERGAIEGQVFHRGAVVELSDERDRDQVAELLHALQQREYLHPTRAEFLHEAAFRVRHILIRDAAYEGIPKKVRSQLHARFADWLAAKAGQRAAEYDEILGYHFEQAYRYREELGPVGEAERALASRAASALERAGRRALERRDSPATANLLSRAAALLPPESELRLDLLQLVGEELAFMMDLDRAADAFHEVHERATALGNRRLQSHARIWLGLTRFFADPEFGAAEMLTELAEVQLVFEELGQERGIARTHDWRAFAYSHLGRFSDSEREAEKATELFRRIGDHRLTVEQFWYLGWAAVMGPRPVEEGIVRCRRILEEAGDDPAVSGHTWYSLARLEAKRGRFDDARALVEQARAIFEETGMMFTLWHPVFLGEIERLAGDDGAAERELRRSLEPLEANFDFPSLTNAAALLGELLVDDGRVDEADELLAHGTRWAPKDQPIQHARLHAARARLLARREDRTAEAGAREAIALSAKTDFLELQADCRIALADVLRLAGRGEEATEILLAALRLYERKGNVVSYERARASLQAARSAR